MKDQIVHFEPSQADSRDFRAALGGFATGVTIVTCDTGSGPLGMTANSFTSLSLDPPLILWAPAKRSARAAHFVQAEHFAVHVLAADQHALCHAFSRQGDAFGDCNWFLDENGVPLIDGCLSRFVCRRYATHDGGDHTILVGEVLAVTTRPGLPLIFQGGRYGDFSAR